MSYNNNINSGNPPMVWSDFDSALQQINENFNLLGAVLARTAPISIANVDTENPVKITTTTPHSYTSGQRATITQTGISQLDNNTYYVAVISSDEVNLYTDENLTSSLDGSAFDAYSSGGGFIQGLSEFSGLDFENLYSNLSPNKTEFYDLGSPTKRWKDLYLSGTSLYLGNARITSTGTAVNLPSGSTVGGESIVSDLSFYSEIQVNNELNLVAESVNSVLGINSDPGIQLVVDSSGQSITISNDGVTELTTSGAGIGLSSNKGDIVITNDGVTSINAGIGLSVNTSSGAVTIVNEGIISINPGIGIEVEQDSVFGSLIISNLFTKFFSTITVNDPDIPDSGLASIDADLPDDNFLIERIGDGLLITTDPAQNIIAFTNTGVTSLAVGSDLNITSATGNITLTLDAVLNRDLVGNVTGTFSGTMSGTLDGNFIGSVFADNSSLMLDGIDNALFVTSATIGNIISVNNITGNTGGTISGFLNVTGDTGGDITGFTNITGDTGGTISGFLNVTGDTGGTISGFLNITGDSGGDITGFTNITGDSGGDIIGFTNITGDSGGDITGFTNITGDSGGDITGFTNITGDSGGTISGFTTITGDSGGTISGFTTITGDSGGDITGFTNITGDSGGDITGFTNITGDTGGTISGFLNVTGDTGGTISGFLNVTGDTGGTISGFLDITGDGSGTISGFATVIGDVKGSVFADNSTVMVNAIDVSLNANNATIQSITSNSITASSDLQLSSDDGNYTITLNATGDVELPNKLFVRTLDTPDSSAINVEVNTNFYSSIDINQDITVGGKLSVAQVASDVKLEGITTIVKTTDILNTKTAATGVVDHDYLSGTVFYHSSISSDFTANFINIPSTENRVINFILVLNQGAIAYTATAIQINGVSQTIKYVDAAGAPVGNNNQLDIMSFTLIKTQLGWDVIAGLNTYG